MKKRIYLPLTVTLVVGLCLSARLGLSQVMGPQQLLARAEDSYQGNNFDAAYTDLQAVRNTAPGSDAAKRAQFEIAAMQAMVGQNFSDARANYQELKSTNVGTLAEFEAEFSLIDLDFAERRLSLADYWNRADVLIQKAGGQSLAYVSSRPSSTGQVVAAKIRPVPGVDPVAQFQLLGDLYNAVSGAYFGDFSTSTTSGGYSFKYRCTNQELERALAVSRFVVQNWPFPANETDDSRTARMQMVELYLQGLPPRIAIPSDGPGGWAYPNPDKTAPRIDKLLPRNGKRVSSSQSLRFRISDGGILQSQVDITSIVINLDGADVTSSFKVEKRFYPRSKRSYLVILGRSLNSLSLSAGDHTFTVACSDHDGNKASQLTKFSVKSQGRPDDDDDDHDDKDDDLERD